MLKDSPTDDKIDLEESDLILNPDEQENSVEHPTKSDEYLDQVDPNIDEQVDSIVESEESEQAPKDDPDEQVLEEAFDKHPLSWKEKVKSLYHQWWNNKKIRYGTFAGLFGLIVFLILLPPSRYFMLNTAGVRSKMSMTVYDQSTRSPLKNVTVIVGANQAKTDSQGKANLSGVRLGSQKVVIQKRAFAEFSKVVTIGWGSNPLGNFDIKPVGAQYVFYLTDWLSGKPIVSAQANSGEFDARADEQGKLVLTIDANSDEDLPVTIKADEYRDETIKLDLNSKKAVDLKMVAGRKATFVSKRSGKYDLYKIDVDGQNEQIALAGTGRENSNIALLSHPKKDILAYVSTRDNVRNKDGYLLNTLTIIDLSDNSTESVVQSEDIRLIGWSGDKLVFIQTVAGASASNPKRQRLISYDYKTNIKIELASSNGFNDALLIGSSVYYAPGNLYASGTNNVFSQNVDGTNKTSILAKETYNIFRTDFDQLTLSVGSEWYSYKIGDQKATRSSSAPNDLSNRQYVSSPDGKQNVWNDERDGKGVLLLHQDDETEDKTLKSQSGLQAPVRWLNNKTIIYRIQTSNESADYVMSIDGGQAKKIRDVTRTIGIR